SGNPIAESILEAEARMEEDGTPIGELERLARLFGLRAHVQQATVEQLRAVLAKGGYPIVYLNRTVFDLPSLHELRLSFADPKLHAVVTTRISDRFVTFHDPLPPRITRRSIARFDRAQRFLGYAALVCGKPEEL